jgi:spore maturation protein CgeB
MSTKNPSLLVLGSFADPGAMEHRYLEGLSQQAWDVHSLEIVSPVAQKIQQSLFSKGLNRIIPSYFLKTINQELLKKVKSLNPTVIMVFKGMTLFPETIEELKKHTKIICNYNPDHPLKIYSRGASNQYIINSVPLYDIFFTYATRIEKKLKEQHINAYTIPFAYDSSLVNKFSPLYDQSELPTFLFVGAWDREREKILEDLGREDVDIYGDEEWATRTNKKQQVHAAYRGKKLYEADLYNKIRSVAGVINILREQNIAEESHNMRTFEVPGYGGLLLSQFTEEQAAFFEPEKEAVYFHTIDELNEKMQHLKNNPRLIKNIKAQALHRSISSGYSYIDRAAQLSGILKKHLN